MTITEFLEARIAEDETAAREVETDFEFDPSNPLRSALDVYAPGYDTYPVISIDSTRVLAECAAKRAIIAHADEASMDRSQVIGEFCVGQEERDREYATDPGLLIMRELAAIYADHQDYQQEWDPRG